MEIDKIQSIERIQKSQQTVSLSENFAAILAEKLKTTQPVSKELPLELQTKRAIESALLYGIPVQANKKIAISDNQNTNDEIPIKQEVTAISKVNRISSNMAKQYTEVENLYSKKKSPR